MRVAFAMIDCNRRDGHARAVTEVAERLGNRGYDVHLYARTAENIDLNIVKWHAIPGLRNPELANFWTYQKLADIAIARQKFDIIHSVGPNTRLANVVSIQNIQPAKALVLGPLGAKEKVSRLRRFSRALYYRVTTREEKKLFENTKRKTPFCFLPVSVGVERELRRHYNIGNAKVRIIPNAADTSVFYPRHQEVRDAWRQANDVPTDATLAIFSGGEWTRKGLELAIQSMAMVPDRKLHLFVAGDDPDRKRYKQLAIDSGVANRVLFGGFRSDIALAMAASDLFLFPSYYEAFSLASIEAAACGLPIIASKINGTEDFIQPGVTGEFIPHDASGIAIVLNRLLADRIGMRKMGMNARDSVWKEYTWDRVTVLTEQAYEATLCGTQGLQAG
jgi:glycosyltransferase involved in cell wall biosynthesis